MRIWRQGGGALAWLLATVLGAGTVWVGLRPVLNTALPDRAIPLTASDLRRLTPSPEAPAPEAPQSPTVTESPTPRETSERPTRAPSKSPSRSSAPTPAPSKTAAKQTVVNGWTATDSGGKTTYVRSFRLDGGQAVIQIVDQVVSLISATPATGFAADTAQPSPERLVVRFTGGGRAYTIDALWFNNGPYAEITES